MLDMDALQAQAGIEPNSSHQPVEEIRISHPDFFFFLDMAVFSAAAGLLWTVIPAMVASAVPPHILPRKDFIGRSSLCNAFRLRRILDRIFSRRKELSRSHSRQCS